ALAEVDGPQVGLDVVDSLQGDLDRYHLFHATRADLLCRLDRSREAAEAYDAALAVTTNAAERGFLENRRRSVR
ncbi:RNA polymerase sigma factor, partial [Actinacidiphila oryziradicis]